MVTETKISNMSLHKSQMHIFKIFPGTSLVVQWLRLCAPNAGATGLIPGRESKVPHAAQRSQKKVYMYFIYIYICIFVSLKTSTEF